VYNNLGFFATYTLLVSSHASNFLSQPLSRGTRAALVETWCRFGGGMAAVIDMSLE
jgi:hypothetical protein